jgi:hypothetical protein
MYYTRIHIHNTTKQTNKQTNTEKTEQYTSTVHTQQQQKSEIAHLLLLAALFGLTTSDGKPIWTKFADYRPSILTGRDGRAAWQTFRCHVDATVREKCHRGQWMLSGTKPNGVTVSEEQWKEFIGYEFALSVSPSGKGANSVYCRPPTPPLIMVSDPSQLPAIDSLRIPAVLMGTKEKDKERKTYNNKKYHLVGRTTCPVPAVDTPVPGDVQQTLDYLHNATMGLQNPAERFHSSALLDPEDVAEAERFISRKCASDPKGSLVNMVGLDGDGRGMYTVLDSWFSQCDALARIVRTVECMAGSVLSSITRGSNGPVKRAHCNFITGLLYNGDQPIHKLVMSYSIDPDPRVTNNTMSTVDWLAIAATPAVADWSRLPNAVRQQLVAVEASGVAHGFDDDVSPINFEGEEDSEFRAAVVSCGVPGAPAAWLSHITPASPVSAAVVDAAIAAAAAAAAAAVAAAIAVAPTVADTAVAAAVSPVEAAVATAYKKRLRIRTREQPMVITDEEGGEADEEGEENRDVHGGVEEQEDDHEQNVDEQKEEEKEEDKEVCIMPGQQWHIDADVTGDIGTHSSLTSSHPNILFVVPLGNSYCTGPQLALCDFGDDEPRPWLVRLNSAFPRQLPMASSPFLSTPSMKQGDVFVSFTNVVHRGVKLVRQVYRPVVKCGTKRKRG